ncbi:metal ABC transporter solute-binding protein, Zn/Mn family [Desulfolutivibrio sulfoxidireducens]|uniref:metal ABC transporter solute-binding protein, Zn/Mn family n=1 Tax=Desulfolutivibrio sulfoxidireducens TaxID=2773299 RepID=UPI00159DD9DF|nr:zinc ABC transporter substrate-binding protein [Desulfolutivibrio sulfoxidireducens]QLA17048.1 ABC transporter substrate-binding protein [Desulfolutivibrio sulfoxidireducens]
MKRLSLIFFLVPVLVFALAVASALAEPVPVTVSIAPQAYFAKRIGGDKVDVTTMVPPGTDAHTFEPKPSQMAALQKAKIYFAVGIDFEKAWLPRFADVNKTMTIVHTDANIVKMAMVPHAHDHAAETGHDHAAAPEAPGHAPDAASPAPPGQGHDHAAEADHDHAAEAGQDHDHHHDHAGLDPHVWLSPAQVKILATAMRDALIAADPGNTDAYRVGYESLIADIGALDARLRAIFAPVPPQRRKFMVFHPAWGYFARQYGLTQVPVEREGKEPGPAELAALIDEAKKDGITVVFVQPQFSTRNAEVVAQGIGGTVVPVNPLAEDWLANMDKAAAAFQAAMK